MLDFVYLLGWVVLILGYFLQTIFHVIFHFYQFDAAVAVGAVVLFSSGIDSGREMGLGVDGIIPIAGRRWLVAADG